MFYPASGIKVFLGLGHTDMRKSIDGLSIQVSHHLEQDPFSGNLYVFCNRKRTIIKILYWHGNGFCIWQKRLEKHLFRWPESRGELQEISHRELSWLLEGLDMNQPHAHKGLTYTTLY